MLANNETGVLQPLARGLASVNRTRTRTRTRTRRSRQLFEADADADSDHSEQSLSNALGDGDGHALDPDAYVQRVFTQRPPALHCASPHVYLHTDASQVCVTFELFVPPIDLLAGLN